MSKQVRIVGVDGSS